MADYEVGDFVYRGTAEEVLALIETKLETLSDARDIRQLNVKRTQGNEFIGTLIIDDA